MEDIRRLAEKYHYKLIYNQENGCKPLRNDCVVAGKCIWIGDYDCEEFKIISFFHEHGHSLVSQEFKKKWLYNTLIIEIEAWRLGIEEARKEDILFSDKAIEWGYNKAMTYVGHDEREVSNWKDSYGSKLWKNKRIQEPEKTMDRFFQNLKYGLHQKLDLLPEEVEIISTTTTEENIHSFSGGKEERSKEIKNCDSCHFGKLTQEEKNNTMMCITCYKFSHWTKENKE